MSIRVMKPGMLTTVQDLGRWGFQKYGVPVSGAMDKDAARIANMLVGNEETDAVLEVTLSGAEFRMEHSGLIAICGGDLKPVMDGEALPMWRPLFINEGSRIKFRGPDYSSKRGCRAYIAAAGGMDVPVLMGSRSTYVRGGLGGYSGRMLQSGDTLPILKPEVRSRLLEQLMADKGEKRSGYVTTSWFINPSLIYSRENVIRVVEGNHFTWMSSHSQIRFEQQKYVIEPSSDRMGYRLRGMDGPLELQGEIELLSEGVSEGTIQLPPVGEPIVLLADRQTTGGYPRIAQVASVDLALLAQFPPGVHLSFRLIRVQEAETLLIMKEILMNQLRSAIQLKLLLGH
ncbi:biotin-dependent carboxyltransferase family protein [Paenibacillus urinalis]|uniref:Biotin-dependent carboxyltransferase family protein n=1 Tax=Paenibacillus urinalis TaxID=521520 RepID=A0AAX3N2D0_9BACL|nr:biotin-dependent carboxyltransferase family protein [Paenibacillus urinalis]WDH83702.1 biotin-dependent carboxyltransferase family protein [Paenibacillus urinalis]